MIAINSSSGELYVSNVIDREDRSLIRTEGVLQIIVKVRGFTCTASVNNRLGPSFNLFTNLFTICMND